MSGVIKSRADIESMRQSGQILARALEAVKQRVKPGITTEELDAIAVAETRRHGGEPAFLGHDGFPKSLCTSINEAVVHGIPSGRKLAEGDIVGLDYGVRFMGLITDAAITVPVGRVSPDARRLLSKTEEALYRGLDQACDGARIGDISAAIEAVLLGAGLGIVRELTGHGVGHSLWESPQITNYGTANTGSLIKAGMTLAIEPMATLGADRIRILNDGWTIVTQDGSLAAQFEHTILVTDSGPEVLTRINPT